MLNRRRFCRLAATTTMAALVAPAIWPKFALAQGENLTLQPLRERAWALTGGGGNSLLIKTAAGPVLIDTKVFQTSEELYDLVSDTTGSPSMIVNTHHHGDHVGGNWRYLQGSGNIDVIAHANAQPRTGVTLESRVLPALDELAADPKAADRAADLRAWLKPEHFQATRTFTESMTVDLDDTTLELSHHGPGHTDNDAVVFVPELNLLHVGDLVFHRLHGFVDMDGGCAPLLWPEVLRGLKDVGDSDTIVVPGHGDITDRSALPLMAEYFDRLRDVVESSIKEGMSREQVMEIKPAVFDELGFASILPRALGGVFDALSQ